MPVGVVRVKRPFVDRDIPAGAEQIAVPMNVPVTHIDPPIVISSISAVACAPGGEFWS
jgi:hypothetical protein